MAFFGGSFVPYGVAQDIQMLKFGQIVDLDLIERSAPNKYVQDRWSARRDGMGEIWEPRPKHRVMLPSGYLTWPWKMAYL